MELGEDIRQKMSDSEIPSHKTCGNLKKYRE